MKGYVSGLIVSSIALACALPARARSNSEPTGSERNAEITIRDNSNVCVSVHVDQQIWPQPIDDDTARNLSGSLMTELRRPYFEMGGSYAVPNSTPAERFVTNHTGATPSCQDRDTDILIDVQYRPRFDGKPFVFEYRITQGQIQRTGAIDVNVEEEMRVGGIRGYDQRRTNMAVIGEDLLGRAPTIFKQLKITE